MRRGREEAGCAPWRDSHRQFSFGGHVDRCRRDGIHRGTRIYARIPIANIVQHQQAIVGHLIIRVDEGIIAGTKQNKYVTRSIFVHSGIQGKQQPEVGLEVCLRVTRHAGASSLCLYSPQVLPHSWRIRTNIATVQHNRISGRHYKSIHALLLRGCAQQMEKRLN